MRDYGRILEEFWIGRTGRQIRELGKDARLLAAYLLSCPGKSPFGLFRLSLVTAAHHCSMSERELEGAFKGLSSIGFAFYDEESEEVWVPGMARFQIGEPGRPLKPSDNRVKWIVSKLPDLKKSPFFSEFYGLYKDELCLPEEAVLACAEEGSKARPTGGAQKGHRSYPIPIPIPIPVPVPKPEGGSGAPARAEIGFKPESRSRSPDAVMSSGGQGPKDRIGFGASSVRFDDPLEDVAQELLRLWPQYFPDFRSLRVHGAQSLALGFMAEEGGWPEKEQVVAVETVLKCVKWKITRPKAALRAPAKLMEMVMGEGNEGYRIFADTVLSRMREESAGEDALQEALRRRRRR